jgi:uncharacterized protein (DUF2249 family)
MSTTIRPDAPTDVVLASTAEDAAAVETVRQHHAELAGRLAAHSEALIRAAGGPDVAEFDRARAAAVSFCTGQLLPHAAAEEDTLYPAAATPPQTRLLVESMISEHRVLDRLVRDLSEADEPVRAAAAGHALRVLFDAHLAKENDLILPAVAADPAVSLADVLAGMHELLGQHAGPEHGGESNEEEGHTGCGCGGDAGDAPELDVRAVPHSIRHATVTGAFDAIPPGGSLLLVAPHDPLPLLRQLAARTDGAMTVSYEQRGPDAWRLRLTRT